MLALDLSVLFDFLSSLDSLHSSRQNWKSQRRFLWLGDVSYEDKIEGKTGKSLKTMNFLFQPLQLHESILRSFFFKNMKSLSISECTVKYKCGRLSPVSLNIVF